MTTDDALNELLREPPPRVKTRAPGRIQPRSEGSLPGAADAFLRAQEMGRAFTREGPRCGLRRTSANPFFGLLRVRLATGLLGAPAPGFPVS